jgi:hypothetical protein
MRLQNFADAPGRDGGRLVRRGGMEVAWSGDESLWLGNWWRRFGLGVRGHCDPRGRGLRYDALLRLRCLRC